MSHNPPHHLQHMCLALTLTLMGLQAVMECLQRETAQAASSTDVERIRMQQHSLAPHRRQESEANGDCSEAPLRECHAPACSRNSLGSLASHFSMGA